MCRSLHLTPSTFCYVNWHFRVQRKSFKFSTFSEFTDQSLGKIAQLKERLSKADLGTEIEVLVAKDLLSNDSKLSYSSIRSKPG